MKILKMRASFGKLHDTLELHDGLNLLYLPNESGKSTWSAFLTAMLYGIDSSERATKANAGLPAKERYRPWDGSPMEGSVELEWRGRYITIERTSTRFPMGSFRAFETDSGLPVPELTAENCGRILCGVERSVFERTAFVRQLGVEVSSDPELEKRLSTMVTTGEELAVPYSKLEKQLHAMQNSLSFRGSGQISKLTAGVSELELKAQTLRRAQEQTMLLAAQLEAAEAELRQVTELEQRVQRAQNAQKRMSLTEAEEKLEKQKAMCETIRRSCNKVPDTATLRIHQSALEQANQALLTARMEAVTQEVEIPAPELPMGFRRHDPSAVMDQVNMDLEEYQQCQGVTATLSAAVYLLSGLILLVITVVTLFKKLFADALLSFVMLIGCMVAFLVSCTIEQKNKNKQDRLKALAVKYGSEDPNQWLRSAQDYTAACKQYAQQRYEGEVLQKRREAAIQEAETRLDTVVRTVAEYAPDTKDHKQAQKALNAAMELQSLRESEERTRAVLEQNVQTLRTILEDVPTADDPEALLHTQEEMQQKRQEAEDERDRLSRELAHKRGELGALGDLTRLEASLEAQREQLEKAKEDAAVIALASEVLRQADAEQRARFSPQITAEAGQILSQLTGGKYAELQLHPDLSLSLREPEGTVLRPAAAMSCGTADQMYLALRLAMCHRLLPQDTPLVLDDALVNFDPERTAQALRILRGEQRQILMFSCRPLEV